jgi:hypothetical protein
LFCIAEIEAAEACKWLRAAGFPQYAQMYEGECHNRNYVATVVTTVVRIAITVVNSDALGCETGLHGVTSQKI